MVPNVVIVVFQCLLLVVVLAPPLQSDLCAAHNLLAPDADWLNPPEVTYVGPPFDPEADEAESDLDTQYMAMMGSGVPVSNYFFFCSSHQYYHSDLRS